MRGRPRKGPSAPLSIRPAYPQLMLRKELGAALRGGHPWVYRDALHPDALRGLETGQVVDLCDRTGAFLARGVYDAASPLAARVYTLDPAEPVDGALLARRLRSAFAGREALFPEGGDTDAYRLCNGEGDLLPGVVLDRYGGVCVLRLDGAGPASLRPLLREVLPPLLRERRMVTLYERSPEGPGALLWGEAPPDEVPVLEHGVRFGVDVTQGQKTGLFLDMREGRRRVRALGRGRSVWNGFSYTGGFSLQAALGGARSVVTVDRAAPAIAAARRNFAQNGLSPDDPRFTFCAEDVFAHLRRAAAMGLAYELIIADPPSFAPSQAALPRAVAAYRALFTLCLGALARGGLLCAGSCSSHLGLERFLQVLGEAGAEAQRPLRVLEAHGQPADHPSLPLHPEGRYLKFVVLRAD